MPSEEYPPSSDEESDFLSRSNPSGNVHFLPPRFDEILEINVESLLGTTFELRLSANTTIGRIKSRLQGSEGIAKQHLHLLHRDCSTTKGTLEGIDGSVLYSGIAGVELQDELTLADCGIQNGATLKLVLSMRGGPINTRRIAMPPPKQHQQQHADLHNLMMRNKAQILEKIPANGQVTVLLLREGDKVNLYHVQEKADGSFTPLSPSDSGNEPNWSGRSSSLRNLLSKDPRTNPDLDERLKENAVTMNKMTELRAQLENLSMNKKKRKQNGKPKRVGSGATTSALGARPRSKGKRITSTSATASSAMTSNRMRTAQDRSLTGLARRNTLPSKGLSGSLSGAAPLPPINQTSTSHDLKGGFTNERLRELDYDEEFCTILPLPPKTGRLSRQSSLSSTLPSLAGMDLSESLLHRTSKSKKAKKAKRGKTTQSRISEESISSRVPQWLEKNDLHHPRSQFKNFPERTSSKDHVSDHNNLFDDDDEDDFLAEDYADDDIDSFEGEYDPHQPLQHQQQQERPRNIDLIDLQFRPNEDESLKIVNFRKTQKLISADIRSLVQGGNSPVRGQPKKRKPYDDNSTNYSGRFRRNITSSTASETSPTTLQKLTKNGDAKNYEMMSNADVSYNLDSPLGTPQGRGGPLLALRASSSRMSSSKRRQLPLSSHSRRTTSSRSQSSAKRPTFVANTLPTSGSAARRRKKGGNSKKPRCAMTDCKKKLTLTNTFSCRCDLSFCPSHRHPEWHNCPYDYKTEGRLLLEKANPIVTVPKLPKI